jgi:Acetyltransferase (GNAT) domain
VVHSRPSQGAAPEEAELGYRLCRPAWGKGYATEGSCALIRQGFPKPWPYPVESQEFGVVQYALAKADWEQQQADPAGSPGTWPPLPPRSGAAGRYQLLCATYELLRYR